MNYRILFYTFLFSCFCLNNIANNKQLDLNSTLNELDLVNQQVQGSSQQVTSKARSQISNIVNEITFNSGLRIKIAHKFENEFSIQPSSKLQNSFEQLIFQEKKLSEEITKFNKRKDSFIDKHTAKKIGVLADSIFVTMGNIDIAFKNKVDSVYVNSIEIKNSNYIRTIIVENSRRRTWLYAALFIALLISLFGILRLFITKKFNPKRPTFYLLASFVVILIIVTNNSTFVNRMAGEKIFLLNWENATYNGHKLNSIFMSQSKTKAAHNKLSNTGRNAIESYYLGIYTSVNPEQARDLFKNIQFINAILFPPAPIQDSATTASNRIKNDTLYSVNPAWYSRYNFTKIPNWNRMLGRGNTKGNNIDPKKYYPAINFLLNDNIDFKEIKSNEQLYKSATPRMKLDMLLKIKAAL